jgi:hypothetical protein
MRFGLAGAAVPFGSSRPTSSPSIGLMSSKEKDAGAAWMVRAGAVDRDGVATASVSSPMRGEGWPLT